MTTFDPLAFLVGVVVGFAIVVLLAHALRNVD